MTLDALFLSPHPDDVELFCGATVAKLGTAGADIAILDLTAGEAATNGTVQSRRAASLEAARILGVRREREVLGLPDGGLNAADSAHLASLVDYLKSHACRLLFAPWPADRHPDHVAAGELARKAQFHAGLRGGRRPERLVFYANHHPAPEHVYVEITDQMDRWRDALACYADQFSRAESTKPTPINRRGFLPAQEARRREWGRRAGCEFAEAFALESAPLIESPLDLLGGSLA